MGNTSLEHALPDYSSDYIIIDDQQQIKRLKNMRTGQQILMRTINSLTSGHSEKLHNLIGLKMLNSCPYVSRLKYSTNNKVTQLCSSHQQFNLLFESPHHTLRQEVEKRQRANTCFDWSELELIMESLVKGLKYFQQVKHTHQQISLSSIYVNQSQNIILADPWLISHHSQECAQSPQRKMFLQGDIQLFDHFKSCLYEIAFLILSLAPHPQVQARITSEKQSDIQLQLRRKFEYIPKKSLQQKLCILTNPEPDKRTHIYNIDKPQKNHIISAKHNRKDRNHHNYENSANILYDRLSFISQYSPQNKKRNQSQLQARLARTFESFPSKQSVQLQKDVQNQIFNAFQSPNQVKTAQNTHITTHNQQNKKQLLIQQGRPNLKNVEIQRRVNTSLSYCPPTLISQAIQEDQYEYSEKTNKQKSIIIQKYPKKTQQNKTISQTGIKKLNNQTKQFQVRVQPINIRFQNIAEQKDSKEIEPKTPFFRKDLHIGTEKKAVQSPNSTLMNSNPLSLGQSNPLCALKDTNNVKMKYKNEEEKSFIFIDEHHQKQSTKVGNQPSESEIQKEEKNINMVKMHQKRVNNLIDKNEDQRVFRVSYQESDVQEGYQPHDRSTPIDQSPLNRSQFSNISKSINNFPEVHKEMNGDGVFKFLDGSYYKGNLKQGLPQGYGRLFYPDGKLSYDGQWVEGRFSGLGKSYPNHQIKLVGSYDQKDLSKAFYFWVKYQGEFKRGKRCGKGKIKFNNGDFFIGQFAFNKAEGNGQYLKNDGKTIKGLWKNNKLLDDYHKQK